MQIDWDSLGKLDVVFGIAGGVLLVFSAIRWTARRMKIRHATKFLAWSIIGEEDEQALVASLKDVVKLVIAALVWAIIGAIIGAIFVIALSLFAIASGGQVSGTAGAIAQYAAIGAFVGAVFRAMIWPIFSIVRKNWRARRDSYKARYNDFIKQKQRVESRINKAKDND